MACIDFQDNDRMNPASPPLRLSMSQVLLCGAAIVTLSMGMRMVHDPHQRIGDHPRERSGARHDRSYRHHQEPDRNILALGDIAFLSSLFELLLCWLFCLLAVVLLFCHGGLPYRQDMHLAVHFLEPDHHPATKAESSNRKPKHHGQRHRRHENLHLRDKT